MFQQSLLSASRMCDSCSPINYFTDIAGEPDNYITVYLPDTIQRPNGEGRPSVFSATVNVFFLTSLEVVKDRLKLHEPMRNILTYWGPFDSDKFLCTRASAHCSTSKTILPLVPGVPSFFKYLTEAVGTTNK